ncbi:MAG: chorismate mutase [Alphaproteobacteria bacterium]|nr:chorismate mutase [Alphaproteobacteria bacterium]
MDMRTPKTSSKSCETMAEVREEIDRLDRLLVALLAERQGYIEAAGRIKAQQDEVRLPWRIEDVVAKVLAESARQGLSKRIAEPVWRELIDRCIAHEQEIWALEHPEDKKITK